MAEKYPLEELASLPEFYHPAASPDGEKVAFYWDRSGRNELYILDRSSGDIKQLSDGEVPKNARWHIMWDNKGEKVLFHKDEGGNEQNDIYSMDLEGSVKKEVELDGQCILQDVSPDGGYVLFTSDRDEQMNLFRYSFESGKIEKLTDYKLPVWSAVYSPDGEWIAYQANESDDLRNKDIYQCKPDGSEKRKLDIGEEGAENSPVRWSPDGKKLLVTDNSEDMNRPGIYHVEEEKVDWFGDENYEDRPVAFKPNGDGFLGFRIKNASWIPVYFGLDGTVKELELKEGVSGFPFSGGCGVFVSDSSFIVSYTQGDRRKELLEYDMENDDHKVLLEAEYGDLDPDSFVPAEYVTYGSHDGVEIGALLYDPGVRPSPAVVMVHGGPHGQSIKAFNIYAQFLASRGYAVLQPNYRGSIGKGREFKRMIHMDWGGMEQDDVAAGAEWLKEQDWIDEDRIAVFGGSYGGYSVYMQMVRYPELWTTGVAWIGISDLHKLYEGDMPHFQAMLREQMGDPEENYELWRDRSPIEHIENMKNPILMIHGVNDPRCPIEQARIFKEGLEDMGWEEGEDFEYEELSEEGHGSTDINQKIRAFQILEDYLERRL
ncbi:MAG: prolyl oligopeptidase family serine peptidase [Thermoplasmatota archaeon]